MDRRAEPFTATLPGQRPQFTYALNQYNLSDDPDIRRKFVQAMAKYVAAAPAMISLLNR